MRNRIAHRLDFSRKALLAVAASLAVAGPLVVGVVNISPTLQAQSDRPAFEVISIKPHAAADRPLNVPLQFEPNGRFSGFGLPVQVIIAVAYNLPIQSSQLAGGPDWIRSVENRYDIEAKADPDALKGLSGEERVAKGRLMLQSLLAERFHLILRRETSEQPVYILTVGKNGPKLQQSKLTAEDCEDPANHCGQGGAGQGQGIHIRAMTVPNLVLSVANYTDHPLLDRTGLTGLYDIDTEGWVPMHPRPPRPPGTEPSAEDIAFADPARPTLYTIFDRLGLKMEQTKAPVEMFVINHVEKPTEN